MYYTCFIDVKNTNYGTLAIVNAVNRLKIVAAAMNLRSLLSFSWLSFFMKCSGVLNIDLIVRNQISCDINGKIMQMSTILITMSDYSSAVVNFGAAIFIFRFKSIHVDELSVCIIGADGMCNKH